MFIAILEFLFIVFGIVVMVCLTAWVGFIAILVAIGIAIFFIFPQPYNQFILGIYLIILLLGFLKMTSNK